MTTNELIEKYGIGHNCLSDTYEQGKHNGIKEIYMEILYIENKFRSMLINTNQKDNLIEWVDLNGKLTAITMIKQLIGDKLKESKNEGI